MNGNPFYVSPLGGLDVGGMARQTFSDIRDSNQQAELMDMQRTQFEQGQQDREAQAAAKAQMQELAGKAMGGDIDALQQVYTLNPQMGEAVKKGLDIQTDDQSAQVGGWLQQYYSKPKGERYKWLQESAKQSPVAFDDKFLGMPEEEVERSIMLAAPTFLSKEQMGILQPKTEDSPKYTNIKRAEDGNLYGLNSLTQEIEQVKTPEGVTFGGESGQTINVNTDSNKQREVIDKYQGDAFVSTQQAATDARKQMQNLNSLEALADKAFSGAGAGVKKNLAKIGQVFGIDVEGLSETEIFESVANELTLGKTAMMTGVLTDRDMAFLQSTVPQLTQTADGRKKLIKIAKKMNQRQIEYAKQAAKFRRENDGVFNQFDFEQSLMEQSGGKDFLADFYPTDEAGVTDFSNMSTDDLMKTAFGGN